MSANVKLDDFSDVELLAVVRFLGSMTYESLDLVDEYRRIKGEIKNRQDVKAMTTKNEYNKGNLVANALKPDNPDITFLTPGRLAACIDILDLFSPSLSAGAVRKQLQAEEQRRADEKAAADRGRVIAADILSALGNVGNSGAISGGLRTDIGLELAKMGYKK